MNRIMLLSALIVAFVVLGFSPPQSRYFGTLYAKASETEEPSVSASSGSNSDETPLGDTDVHTIVKLLKTILFCIVAVCIIYLVFGGKRV